MPSGRNSFGVVLFLFLRRELYNDFLILRTYYAAGSNLWSVSGAFTMPDLLCVFLTATSGMTVSNFLQLCGQLPRKNVILLSGKCELSFCLDVSILGRTFRNWFCNSALYFARTKRLISDRNAITTLVSMLFFTVTFLLKAILESG